MAAAGVVFAKNPLNSALCLVATLMLVAVHFAFLQAEFLAVLQVLIYAGAIMVLVIFVIMLLGVENESNIDVKRPLSYFGAAATAVFLGVFFYLVSRGEAFQGARAPAQLSQDFGGVKQVGTLLFTKYLFAFELISLLLLAGIIGSVVLASEAKRPLPPGRGLKAKQGTK